MGAGGERQRERGRVVDGDGEASNGQRGSGFGSSRSPSAPFRPRRAPQEQPLYEQPASPPLLPLVATTQITRSVSKAPAGLASSLDLTREKERERERAGEVRDIEDELASSKEDTPARGVYGWRVTLRI